MPSRGKSYKESSAEKDTIYITPRIACFYRQFVFRGNFWEIWSKTTNTVNRHKMEALMKKKAGKAAVALICGALSAIFGAVIGKSIKDGTLDITKLGKDDGHTEGNKTA